MLSENQQERVFTELANIDLKRYANQNVLNQTQKECLFLILKERSRSVHKINATLSDEAQKNSLQKCMKEFESKIEECIEKK